MKENLEPSAERMACLLGGREDGKLGFALKPLLQERLRLYNWGLDMFVTDVAFVVLHRHMPNKDPYTQEIIDRFTILLEMAPASKQGRFERKMEKALQSGDMRKAIKIQRKYEGSFTEKIFHSDLNKTALTTMDVVHDIANFENRVYNWEKLYVDHVVTKIGQDYIHGMAKDPIGEYFHGEAIHEVKMYLFRSSRS